MTRVDTELKNRKPSDLHPAVGKPSAWRGAIWLIVWSMVIGLVWLVLLPRLSDVPSTAAYLDSLDRKGIDGGATFYTELPMMSELLRKLER